LFVWQLLHRRSQQLLTFVASDKGGFEKLGMISRGARFPPGPALIAAQSIKSGRTDGGVEKGAILDRMLPPPKAHECFLDNIFCVRPTIGPATSEEEQCRPKLCKTDLPSFIGSNSLHDLFTVFYL
jgi:hypothetical protein